MKKWKALIISLAFLITGCASNPTSPVENVVVTEDADIEKTEVKQNTETIVESDSFEEILSMISGDFHEEQETSFSTVALDSDGQQDGIVEVDRQIDYSTNLEAHFIDVGQGDSILVMCDGEAMLIDAGDNSKGTAVQLYLQKRNIEKLKYVIGTHPDADHIGGLDVILYKFDCETVIMPDISNDTATYRDVIDTINQKGYRITLPVVGNQYTLGGASFTIVSPGKTYDDRNNNSVVIKLEHGDNTFLFTGDAEAEAEQDVLQTGIDLQADVLKLGHHGSNSSTSTAFLNAVNPTYAVISCGTDNSYGHPHAETLNNLRQLGCFVYRTDEQGSILISSDGESLSFNCSPSETWKAGEPTGSQQAEVAPTVIPQNDSQNDTQQVVYILNTNTKKFHYSHCSSVKKMKESNKKESSESRDAIISQGYVPCKNCNP